MILSETIALSAIANLTKYLPRAVKDGNDLEARETMGGLFLANPCELNDQDCAGIFEKSYC